MGAYILPTLLFVDCVNRVVFVNDLCSVFKTAQCAYDRDVYVDENDLSASHANKSMVNTARCRLHGFIRTDKLSESGAPTRETRNRPALS